MTDQTFATYEAAAAAYRAAFADLLVVPAGAPATVRRGAGDVPAEQLVERADTIAGISAQLVTTGRVYREAPDPATRSGITAHLLTQATAETHLALELLELAAATDAAPADAVTRATRTTALRTAIAEVEQTLALPVTAGVLPAPQPTRSAEATTVDAATQSLRTKVTAATGAITGRVVELGGDLAYNLVIGTDWNEVRGVAALFREDVAAQLDKVKADAGQLVARAAAVAQKTLLNVFDKILAVLGKDAENAARKTIQEWLDRLAKDKKIAGLEPLVGALYQVEPFKRRLAVRLEQPNLALEPLNTAISAVDAVQARFITLAGYAGSLAVALSLLRKAVKWYPPVLPVAAGFQVALLATLVYAGWDFIGYGQARFVSVTVGLAKIVEQGLGWGDASAAGEAPGTAQA